MILRVYDEVECCIFQPEVRGREWYYLRNDSEKHAIIRKAERCY